MPAITIRAKRGSFRRKVFVAGFHGVGYVGWIATKHLIEELDTRRIGFIYTSNMQPYVSMGRGIVTPYELYGTGDIVFFLPNIPLSSRDAITVPLALSEYAVRRGALEAVLFGGLDSRFEDGVNRLRYAATTAYIKRKQERLASLGLEKIEEFLYIVGPLAVMLTVFEARGFPALALLPYANASRPDPKAAAEAVKVFNSLLGLSVGVDELLRRGEEIEREVEELKRRFEEARRKEAEGSLYI